MGPESSEQKERWKKSFYGLTREVLLVKNIGEPNNFQNQWRWLSNSNLRKRRKSILSFQKKFRALFKQHDIGSELMEFSSVINAIFEKELGNRVNMIDGMLEKDKSKTKSGPQQLPLCLAKPLYAVLSKYEGYSKAKWLGEYFKWPEGTYWTHLCNEFSFQNPDDCPIRLPVVGYQQPLRPHEWFHDLKDRAKRAVEDELADENENVDDWLFPKDGVVNWKPGKDIEIPVAVSKEEFLRENEKLRSDPKHVMDTFAGASGLPQLIDLMAEDQSFISKKLLTHIVETHNFKN